MMKERNYVPAEDIIRIREEKGWRQDELAVKMGVHKATVSRWESGANKCDGKNATKMRLLENTYHEKKDVISGKVSITFNIEGLEISEIEEGIAKSTEHGSLVVNGINFIAVGNVSLSN